MRNARTTRRLFLSAVGAAGAAACATSGAPWSHAYDPWDYPDADLPPEQAAVAAALLASSPHNTQPWRFAVGPNAVELWVDHARTLGAMDSLGRERQIGVGCALENLMLSAQAYGRAPRLLLWPRGAGQPHVARVELTPAPEQPSALHDVLPSRHTNRAPYHDEDGPADLAAQLASLVAPHETVGVHALLQEPGRRAFANATVAATRDIVADAQMAAASHAWYRHTAVEIERYRDGVSLPAAGLPPWKQKVFALLPRPTAAMAGDAWLANTQENQTSAMAFVTLTTPDLHDRTGLTHVGRVWQRLALWLHTQGLACQPLNQLAEMRDREIQQDRTRVHGGWLQDMLPAGAGHAQMLFRVGRPTAPPGPSPRRPMAWVLR